MKKNKSEATASNASHTPTPIKIDSNTLTLVDKNAKFLTIRELEFIVRAVNEYEALLEENRRYDEHNRALIEAANYATCPSCKHNRCQMLRDAIAQAENRP